MLSDNAIKINMAMSYDFNYENRKSSFVYRGRTYQ